MLDSAHVCVRAELVLVTEWYAGHNRVDSNGHNEPSAIKTMEAHIFQRIPEDGSGTLPVHRNYGSGIHRKNGPKRNQLGGTQKYLLDRSILTPFEMQSCCQKPLRADSPVTINNRTCIAAFKHVKVRGHRKL